MAGLPTSGFRIELSLVTLALTDMQVLAFSKETFQQMFRDNPDLAESVVNWYARYVNRFLFETIHQEFNTSRVRLCNLLYLLATDVPAGTQAGDGQLVLEMTQEDLADLLALSRVQVTRELTWLRGQGILATSRGRLMVRDVPALAALCTDETV